MKKVRKNISWNDTNGSSNAVKTEAIKSGGNMAYNVILKTCFQVSLQGNVAALKYCAIVRKTPDITTSSKISENENVNVVRNSRV